MLWCCCAGWLTVNKQVEAQGKSPFVTFYCRTRNVLCASPSSSLHVYSVYVYVRLSVRGEKGKARIGRLSQSTGQPSSRATKMHFAFFALKSQIAALNDAPDAFHFAQCVSVLHLVPWTKESTSTQHASLSARLFNKHKWLQNRYLHSRMFSILITSLLDIVTSAHWQSVIV